MFTLRDFTPEGQFCELGGELVDSGHTDLIKLCEELGVGIQRLRPEGDAASDIYDVGGKPRLAGDLLDPTAQTGAFIPVAARIAADQALWTRTTTGCGIGARCVAAIEISRKS
jgi:monoamine oxidase